MKRKSLGQIKNFEIYLTIFFSLFFLILLLPFSYAWYSPIRQYRRPIILDNTNNSNNLTDYQIAINLTYDCDMQPDFSDIIFTWYNTTDKSEIAIPFWIENYSTSSWAYVWVKVKEIPANSTTTIYVYYGNTTPVSSPSNTINTFKREISRLVGSWHFDEDSGNITYDSSGNDNNGIIHGANWTNGKFGKALEFDGTDDYVEILTSGFSNNSGSIEMWINFKSMDNKTQFLYDGSNITLFDDFQDGDDNGWSGDPSYWTVENGVYKSSPAAYGTYTFTGDENWVNYTVEAKVKYVSGSSSFYGAFAGIAFRYFYVPYGNYFYAFVMYPTATSNQIQFKLRSYSGGFTTVNATNYSFNVGKFYTLKVVAEGDTIKGYINGEYVLKMTDTAKHRGSVGFFMGGYGEADDFKVKVKNYDDGPEIYKTPDNNLTFLYGNGTLTTNISTWENQWHHVITTWDNSAIKLFVDGQLIGSKSGIKFPLKVVGKNWIGSIAGQNENHSSHFNGIIDEIRIYNKSLNETEILDLYNYYGYTTENCPNKVLIRKYTDPEPTYSIGSEEIGIFISSIKTYKENKLRSFFAIGETVEIRVEGNFPLTPQITIIDSNGTTQIKQQPMINITTSNTQTFAYNYTINGSVGWYKVNISNKIFDKLFFANEVFQSEWTDSLGNDFPFRIRINLSEPGIVDRFFEPIDLHLNFSYKANENSIRVALFNGTNLIEIPSQVYNLTFQNGYVIAGNVVWLTSLSKGENRTYYIYYSRSDFGSPNYSTDLNITNNSDFIEIQNINYKIILNKTKGGVIQEIYSKKGRNKNLGGLNPMQLSPEVSDGINVYRASSVSNPSITLKNMPFLTIYQVEADIGVAFHYILKYKFYSHTYYFILESNVTPKGSGTWIYYEDQKFVLRDGFFSRANWRNSSGVYEYSIGTGNGDDKTSLGNLEWIAAYNHLFGDSFGTIYLSRQQTKSYIPNNAFYDETNYEYLKRTQYSGSVSPNDYFYSKVALIIWNALDNYKKLNETYYRLKNPVNITIGLSETSDSENPIYTLINYTPSIPNDSQNITCYSYWQDNLELDYAIITISSPGFNNQTILQISANESWVNYTILANKLEAGRITCNFTVYDIAGLSNSTQIAFNVSDTTAPYFTSITNEPHTNKSLDPNIQINVTVNLKEYSGIYSVILQYRNFSGEWQNVSMNKTWNDTYIYTYEANFTPSSEGIWQYRIYVNDTLGNSNLSQIRNLTVYWDWTWIHSPKDFGAVSGTLASNISVGNLTINNTGDKPLGFKLVSDWDEKNQIFFNNTPETSTGFIFNLDPKNSTSIEVKVTAKTTERSDDLTITIYALNSSASPSSNTTTATIVSYTSGPFLLVSITNYNSSVTQGDSNILLKAKLQNKGNETATNTWFAFDLPSGWIVVAGDLNNTGIENLSVDEIVYHQILVNISNNAPTGTQVIRALAGCSENKSGIDSVSVVVMPKEVEKIVEEEVYVGGGTTSTTSSASTLTTEEKEKLFQTEETYELVRGREQEFILKVENPFDWVLENVSVDITGFLSQYLKVDPPHVKRIPVNGSFNFTIRIEAPKYFTKGIYNLNFTITGIVNKTRIGENYIATSLTHMKESRLVTLIIHEIPKEEALEYLNKSIELAKEINESGISAEDINLLLSQAMKSLENKDYEKVKSIYERIKESKEKIFSILSLTKEVEEKIEEALHNGIDVPKTMRLVLLSKAALERGDYDTALKRIEDAKLTYALETVGKFNVVVFAKNNWPKLALSTIALSLFSYFAYLVIKFHLITKKLNMLREEEEVLLGLIKEAQRDCFERKKLSMKEYIESLMQYEKRLTKVVQKMVELETKKAHLFKIFIGEEKRLINERKKLINLIKEAQHLYLQTKKLDTRIYENRVKSYVARLAEIEERLAGIEAKKAIKPRFKFW